MDDSSITSLASKGNIDDYCNLVIFLFAQIINLLASLSSTQPESHHSVRASIERLWNELQDWLQFRPEAVRPLLRQSAIGDKPFPIVLFSQSSSGKKLSISETPVLLIICAKSFSNIIE